ncbi:MAG: hypothetical protein J6A91_05475 [Bacteroidales bacterium]|nr:hypothetical protein [Bacteroidales bacterium]
MKQGLDSADVARILKRLDKIEESLSAIKTLLNKVVDDRESYVVNGNGNVSRERVMALILGENLMRKNEARRKKIIKASRYKMVKGLDEHKQIEINVERELL